MFYVVWLMHGKPTLYGPFATIEGENDSVQSFVCQTFRPELAGYLQKPDDFIHYSHGGYSLHLVTSCGTGDAPVAP